MATYYTLQSGTGVIVLPDGSGNYLLQSDSGAAQDPFSVGMRFIEVPFRKTMTLFDSPNLTIMLPIPDTLFAQAWF